MKRKQSIKERIKTKFGLFLMKIGIRLTIKGINSASHPTKIKKVKFKDYVEEYSLKDLTKDELLQLPETDWHNTKKVFKEVNDISINRNTESEERFIFAATSGMQKIQEELVQDHWSKGKPTKVSIAYEYLGGNSIFSKKATDGIISEIMKVKLMENLESKNTFHKIEVGSGSSYFKKTEFVFKLETGTLSASFLIDYNDVTRNTSVKMDLMWGKKRIIKDLISNELKEKIIEDLKEEIKELDYGIL